MTEIEQAFKTNRQELLQNIDIIIGAEKSYMNFLQELLLGNVGNIYKDFGKANELRPFWKNYEPRQRGRAPTGNSTPWIEVAEKTVISHTIQALTRKNINSLEYPGLPLGGDIRFIIDDVLIHFDVKATGPNDNQDEIVASPFQISGDGALWLGEGFLNNSIKIPRRGTTKEPMIFQPSLPPFYLIGNKRLLCLTFFLKTNYVRIGNDQVLDYLELACVPNGLLLFVNPNYHQKFPGLLIAGKDDKTVLDSNRRTRIRFNPLTEINNWPRCVQIKQNNNKWEAVPRVKEKFH